MLYSLYVRECAAFISAEGVFLWKYMLSWQYGDCFSSLNAAGVGDELSF